MADRGREQAASERTKEVQHPHANAEQAVARSAQFHWQNRTFPRGRMPHQDCLFCDAHCPQIFPPNFTPLFINVVPNPTNRLGD